MAAKSCPTEEQEQVDLARWLDRSGELWCHVPNGGRRSPREGARLKRMGVKAGVPDILIFREPRNIAVELKRRHGGSVSPVQKKWHKRLLEAGWAVIVAKGADEARNLIENCFQEDT